MLKMVQVQDMEGIDNDLLKGLGGRFWVKVRFTQIGVGRKGVAGRPGPGPARPKSNFF